MRTQLFVKPLTANQIASFEDNGGFLAFRINGSGLEVGQSVYIATNLGPIAVAIDTAVGNLYTTFTPTPTPLPSSGTITSIVEFDEPDGQRDATFNIGPAGTSNAFNGDVAVVKQDLQGRYVVGGNFTTYKGAAAPRICRLLRNGDLDTTFNPGTGFNAAPRQIYIDSDGTIMVGGLFQTYNGGTHRQLVKLLADGTVDSTFNIGAGFTQTGSGFPYVYEILKQNNNWIILGTFDTFNGVSGVNGIVRLQPTGTRDTTFQTGTGFGGGDRAYSGLIVGDQIYVGGNFTTYDGAAVQRLIRLQPNGQRDTTFRTDPLTTYGIDANVLQIQKIGGEIVICGFFTNVDLNPSRGMARLDAETGDWNSTLLLNNGGVKTYYQLPNGKAYIFGTFTSYDTGSPLRMARILPDLTIDSTFNIGTGLNAGEAQAFVNPTNGEVLVFGGFQTYGTTSPANNARRIVMLRGASRNVFNEVQSIDLREDVQFPLTFSISDITSPQNRKSNYSKTITIPGTKQNDRVFTQIFEIGADGSFDPRIRAACFVTQDGLEVLTGYLKLDSVVRENWNTVGYNLKIYGEVSDLFAKLKNADGTDLLLSDLDITEWTHNVFDPGVVSDSWEGQCIRNGTPYSVATSTFINPVSDTGFAPGGRTVFLIASSSALKIGDVVRFDQFNVNDPTVNFNESYGCHTITDFIDSSGNSVQPTDPTCIGPVVNLPFRSGATNDGDLYLEEWSGEGYLYPGIYTGSTQGVATLFDTVCIPNREIVTKIFEKIGFEWESNFFDSQTFKRTYLTATNDFVGGTATQFTNVPFQNVGGGLAPFQRISQSVELTGLPAGLITLPFSFLIQRASGDWFPATWQLLARFIVRDAFGNFIQQADSLLLDNGLNFIATGITRDGTNIFGNFESPTLSLQSGYTVQVNFILTTFSGTPLPTPSSLTVVNLTIGQRELRLPEMKASDYLKSLITTFNLYIQPERFNSKKVIIEPRDDFYTEGFLDWTAKVDLSQEVEIVPLAPDVSKTFQWTYKKDGDFYNKDFEDEIQKIYGYEIGRAHV